MCRSIRIMARLPHYQSRKGRNSWSPDQQITASTCPVVLIHGANDRCVSFLHSERFHARMEQLGRPCHLHRLEDTDHAFLLAEYTDNLSACLLGIRILDKEIQYAFDEENAPIE